MNREERIRRLEEIKRNDTPYSQDVKIRYRGELVPFNLYKIPLDCLIYNRLNGRIASRVKSWEREHGRTLDPEDAGDADLIEEFLYQSKKSKNQATMRNLLENGQLRHGIVTKDGIIIDGNRRACLLNRIWKNREDYRKKNFGNVDRAEFFIAIILEDEGIDREIQRLETTYQLGEDEKLDYNPIEKYLKVRDLREHFPINDIAKMMGESVSQIEEWQQILSTMENYLEYLSYDGIYTRLEGREDHLINLTKYVERYEGEGSKMVQWSYNDMDVAKLQEISFDYIRARFEGKRFRDIGRPSKKDSIFCRSKELWETFVKRHEETVGQIPEKSVADLKAEHPEYELVKLLEYKDEVWKNQAEDGLEGNLGSSLSKIRNLNRADEPLELAKDALGALESINQESTHLSEEEVGEVLDKVNKLSFRLLKKAGFK